MTTKAQQALLEQIQQLKESQPAAAQRPGQLPKETRAAAEATPSATPEANIDEILDRINNLGEEPEGETESEDLLNLSQQGHVADPHEPSQGFAGVPEAGGSHGFFPQEPKTLREASLSRSACEELILKFLLASGENNGQAVADQTKLPFPIVNDLLRGLKDSQLVHYRGANQLNDYTCELTDSGRDRARRYSDRCSYYGAAPVSLRAYRESVAAQSLTHQRPKEADLLRAFEDLLIDTRMLVKLGAAVNSGKGMFLFGYPGNGKTSIAERVTKAFGETIWIPRSVGIGGEIIRIFDPSQHEEIPYDCGDDIISEQKIDQRWVQIRRPTIIVGGELTMDNLELTTNHATGINEAPVQMKSNCGTLVIDDFGRQRMTTDELLNRWIVPLEKRYDFLNLPSGTKVQVPFDQLVVFSTNLEPKDLVDDAFLRRIPYKIEVENPTEQNFRKLFEIMCPKFGFQYSEKAMDYLLNKHYKKTDRPLRCCHPRDILLQMRNYCLYTETPMQLTPELFDFAAENYFSIV
ncbi:MAG: AAA family ATPase [Planctomycetota bacterium]